MATLPTVRNKPRTAPTTGDPVVIKPFWQSTYPDTGEASKLGPDAWNTERFVSGGNPGDVLMRDPSSSTGASWATLPPLASAEDILAADAATLEAANTHSDGNDATTLASATTAAAQGDADALADAMAYTDLRDVVTLGQANSHADAGDAATLTQAKAYTDAKVPALRKRTYFATPIPLSVDAPINTDVDLWTWTLPANALAGDGDVLAVQAWGQFLAVNAGSRTIALVLGTVTIGTITYSGSQLKPWVFSATLVRASATAQSLRVVSEGDPALVASVQLPALNLAQPQVLALRARQGGKPPSPSLQAAGALVSQW